MAGGIKPVETALAFLAFRSRRRWWSFTQHIDNPHSLPQEPGDVESFAQKASGSMHRREIHPAYWSWPSRSLNHYLLEAGSILGICHSTLAMFLLFSLGTSCLPLPEIGAGLDGPLVWFGVYVVVLSTTGARWTLWMSSFFWRAVLCMQNCRVTIETETREEILKPTLRVEWEVARDKDELSFITRTKGSFIPSLAAISCLPAVALVALASTAPWLLYSFFSPILSLLTYSSEESGDEHLGSVLPNAVPSISGVCLRIPYFPVSHVY